MSGIDFTDMHEQRRQYLVSTVSLAALFRRHGFDPKLLDEMALHLTRKQAPMGRAEWFDLRRRAQEWVDANVVEMLDRQATKAVDDFFTDQRPTAPPPT